MVVDPLFSVKIESHPEVIPRGEPGQEFPGSLQAPL